MKSHELSPTVNINGKVLLQQLDRAFIHVNSAHVSQALAAEMVLTISEAKELVSKLLVKADHACLH